MWRVFPTIGHMEGGPHNASLTHLLMSGQKWMGCVSFQVTMGLLGHVSLGELKMGHTHQGHLANDTLL